MISKATLKSYEFDSIELYFNYIIDSKINGQRKQTIELYHKMSKAQKEAFKDWFLNTHQDDVSKAYIEFLNYLK